MSKLKEQSLQTIVVDDKEYFYYSLKTLEGMGYEIESLPFSIKILLEAAIRQEDGAGITEEQVIRIAEWARHKSVEEVPFLPARVILQDFTGVPAVLDLAAMRAAIKEYSQNQDPAALQKKYQSINPDIPVDLVIDHSVLVDTYGNEKALSTNMQLEMERNLERYRFLKWAQTAFDGFGVVPPGNGIVHQVNLEYLAKVVMVKNINGREYLIPDTLVGTDSHTTMINGLGVLGWGVGGIEAEAGMLGQPSYLPLPEVVGVEMTGSLEPGVTATDLALTVTRLLRSQGVVDKFIEFFGEGVAALPLADRATIANMAPEYGATCGFFPVDQETLHYLALSGRTQEEIRIIEAYLKSNGMFQDYSKKANYSTVLQLDLHSVQSSLSGPKRPQDQIFLNEMKDKFLGSITEPLGNGGHGLPEHEIDKQIKITSGDSNYQIGTGAVVIAAITSCTNTSNPSVMLGAGLLAKNAVAKGLKVPAYVKTSLAPGSKVVTEYLDAAGLSPALDQLGFQVVGYGCTTCIGNSGPLREDVTNAITEHDLLTASVLSGNRNFEGRIHPLVKANYLASPMLVVAYALAGTVAIDLTKEALGTDLNGNPVYLKDIWPGPAEILQVVNEYVTPDIYHKIYQSIYENPMWNAIHTQKELNYEFSQDSVYIKEPTFFHNFQMEVGKVEPLSQMRVLAVFGDSVTTDHISPAGSIGITTPAGKYLLAQGVAKEDFNTYGSRRGNHEVMVRGTFANIRIRNKLAEGTEGGFTRYWPTGELTTIFEACQEYRKSGTGLVVLAGKDYGMGSSRDWAAKGPMLLGVKAVIAESYERIHRSNLIMMGVLPLEFINGETAQSLGLTGEEVINIQIHDAVEPKAILQVEAISKDHRVTVFHVKARFDSQIDITYYRNGGILPMVLRQKMKEQKE